MVAVATLAAVEEADAGAAKPVGRKASSDAILVPNPVGLHARPAAVLSNLAAQYQSEISLKRGEDQANAKSVMAIMGMEVRYGDKVRVVAYGTDADEAVAELAAQIAVGLGEEGVVPIAEAGAEPAARPRPPSRSPRPRAFARRTPTCCSGSPPHRGWASGPWCRSGTRISRSPRIRTTDTASAVG